MPKRLLRIGWTIHADLRPSHRGGGSTCAVVDTATVRHRTALHMTSEKKMLTLEQFEEFLVKPE